MGLAFPAASIGATAGVAPTQQGTAAALLNTSQQVGSAVGLSILATIAAAASRASGATLTTGFRLSYLVATGFAVLGIILVLSLLNSKECARQLAIQQGAPAPTRT
jgi:sugar phosphate permease